MNLPSSVRAQGEVGIKQYLSTRDASHIQAKAHGGSNAADNMVFEDKKLNRGRNYDYMAGRRDTPHMTQEELEAVRAADRNAHRKNTTANALLRGVKATAVAGLVEGGMALLEEGVEYRQGEISGKEYAKRVGVKAATAAAVGGATAAGYTALCAASPAAAAALPVVALGLAVVGAFTYVVRAKKAIDKHKKIGK